MGQRQQVPRCPPSDTCPMHPARCHPEDTMNPKMVTPDRYRGVVAGIPRPGAAAARVLIWSFWHRRHQWVAMLCH